MAWKGLAAPNYNRKRKKLNPQVQKALNDVQARLLQDPFKGDRKRGPLKMVWVEKFQAENDQYLVAYTIRERQEEIIFLAVGQHENFYRDLQRYMKERVKAEGR